MNINSKGGSKKVNKFLQMITYVNLEETGIFNFFQSVGSYYDIENR